MKNIKLIFFKMIFDKLQLNVSIYIYKVTDSCLERLIMRREDNIIFTV